MRKILLIFISTILVGGLVYFLNNLSEIEKVEAGSEHNVSGWAWSENIGWISFNCTNTGTCGTSNYGVNIDTQSGEFSGYAWSGNLGWLSFNRSDLVGCPNPPCQADLNKITNEISGWAKFLAANDPQAGGWEGWLKLKGTALNGSPYGLTRVGCDIEGWAWGDTVVGWTHFNGSNYGVVSTFCANNPPSATNLEVRQPDYCLSGPTGIFSWTFSDPDVGDYQTGYQVQVDNNSDFSSPEDDSGKVISNSNSYASPQAKLSYNTRYYWRLKVWDKADVSSNWISGPSFATPSHAYPTIDFSWLPQSPSVNELTQFTDQSTVYGGTTKASWFWTFQDGEPGSSNQQNPTVKFISPGQKQVTLRVTDSDGYSCQVSKITPGIKPPLPKWKEIPPIIWLKNFFASIGRIFGMIL